MRNPVLPFDILFKIFSHYEETPECPLENLLLVCRFWTQTALECKRIWSNFKIDLKDGPTVLLWSRQVPGRLERSGPNSPISFSLRLRREYSNCGRKGCPLVSFPSHHSLCKCHRTIQQNVEIILRSLLGSDGSLCARWQSIDISGDRCLIPALVNFFSYPTPQLTSLTLTSVQYQPGDHIFLPSVPSLENIKVITCGLPGLPDLGNAITIHFVDQYDVNASHKMDTTDPIFVEARQVRRLELDVGGIMYQPYQVPTHLHFLEHLSLRGDRLPDNMKQVKAPLLRELGVCFWHDTYESVDYDEDEDNQRMNEHLIECDGIPFHQINTLTIGFQRYYETKLHDDYWNSYHTLLRLCNNVKKICGDRRSTIFILRLLKEDCMDASALINREVVVSNGVVSKRIRAGVEERLHDIAAFSMELGCAGMKEDRRGFLEQIHEKFKGR